MNDGVWIFYSCLFVMLLVILIFLIVNTVEQDRRIAAVVIPDGFVPEDYVMDPRTEYIVEGRDLRKGMVFVKQSRGYADKWCRMLDYPDKSALTYIDFVAEYSDGQQAGRTVRSFQFFIVKKI